MTDATTTDTTTDNAADTATDTEPTPVNGAEAPTTDAAPEATLPPAPTIVAATAPGPAEPSPDGQALAYLQRDGDGALRLWLVPTNGGAPRELAVSFTLLEDADPDDGAIFDGPQWSPDGTCLALVGEHPSLVGTAIWLVTVESGEARLLVDHPASDRSPRWSPDGTQIAFVTHRDGRDQIALAPADGSGPATPLSDGVRDDSEPTWSNDGRMLAFRRRSIERRDQFDICVINLETGEFKQLTTKDRFGRSSLAWAPSRPLIAYVTDRPEWNQIAVVNPENSASWIVTKEPGDKADPRWGPKNNRFLYTRTEGPHTVCCERGLNAANVTVLDPGEGVARSPRWLGEEQVVYGFGAPQRPFGFITQEKKAEDVERVALPPAIAWPREDGVLVDPRRFEFMVGDEIESSGLLYRRNESAGPTPGVIYLGDGPPGDRRASWRAEEQALAAGSLAVLTPGISGASGFGRALAYGLNEAADTEVEVADLMDAATALGNLDDINSDLLAIVGEGFGGTLALLATGGRPGTFQAVVAIDPIADWGQELDHAPRPWREWILRQYGLPAEHPARYAVRTPATFAAAIDVPLMLIGTPGASPTRKAQLETLTALLQESGVPFERVVAGDEPLAATLRRVALPFLHGALQRAPQPEVVEPVAQPDPDEPRAEATERVPDEPSATEPAPETPADEPRGDEPAPETDSSRPEHV